MFIFKQIIKSKFDPETFSKGLKTWRWSKNLTCLGEGNLAMCFGNLKNMQALDPEIQLLRLHPKLIILILEQNNFNVNMFTNVEFIIVKLEYNQMTKH